MRQPRRCGLDIPRCKTQGCNHLCGRRPKHLGPCMLHEPPPPRELPEKQASDYNKPRTNRQGQQIQALEKRLHYLETELAKRNANDQTK